MDAKPTSRTPRCRWPATDPLHDRQLRWQDWTRYSSRQQTTMQLGGVLGSFDTPLQEDR